MIRFLFIKFIILIFSLPSFANFCISPSLKSPTSIRDPKAPWVKAGVDYLKFKPDITNPEDTFPPSTSARDKVIGDIFYIDGDIYPFMVEYFFDGMEGPGKAKNVKTVVLNSFGGIAETGFELAKIFRERGITTIIPAGGTCSSACAIAYQGGVIRRASRDSTLLVHGVRVGTRSMKTIYEDTVRDKGEQAALKLFYETWYNSVSESTIKMFDHFEAFGASTLMRDYYMALPEAPDYFEKGNPLKIQDWLMNACEAASYNLVTEVY